MDFDRRLGYYEVRFGGTAKVLQSYFAVAKIVILLCNTEQTTSDAVRNSEGYDQQYN